MKNVLLVGNGFEGSYQVRGVQTSQALKKYCLINAPYILRDQFLKDIDSIKNSIVIFIGEPLSLCNDERDFMLLNRHGNVLIYDIIDNFCFSHTNIWYNDCLLEAYKYLDVLVHPNTLSKIKAEDILPNCKHVTMPHQWDMRNENIKIPGIINLNKAGYIGTVNGGLQLNINNIKDIVDIYDAPQDVNTHHLKYNIQVSFRKKNNLNYLYKPCTKLAMASSFGAILLTSKEPSVVDIIGESYSFYIESEDELKYKMELIKNMSMEEINYYRQNTLLVKNHLSPKANAKRYLNLLENYA
jgi:hypothetical protein